MKLTFVENDLFASLSTFFPILLFQLIFSLSWGFFFLFFALSHRWKLTLINLISRLLEHSIRLSLFILLIQSCGNELTVTSMKHYFLCVFFSPLKNSLDFIFNKSYLSDSLQINSFCRLGSRNVYIDPHAVEWNFFMSNRLGGCIILIAARDRPDLLQISVLIDNLSNTRTNH